MERMKDAQRQLEAEKAKPPPSIECFFLHLQWYFDMETTSEKSYISLG